MLTDKKIEIQTAKGRPMLTWVGKQPIRYVTAFPAQHIETYGKSKIKDGKYNPDSLQGGLLFHGDNKEVLAHLLANGFRGKVDLIYIDPPFDSGADYIRQVNLRGITGITKLDGEEYTLGEQIQYTDIWANDNYLQFMFERLLILKELLAENGSIYLHCDYRKVHHLRCIMDEIFGSEYFANEIIWCYTRPSRVTDFFPRVHDNILFYSKSNDRKFNTKHIRIPYHKESIARSDRGAGKESAMGAIEGQERLREGGKVPEDYWIIPLLQGNALERTDYPTQKPEALISRIIQASTNPGDLVLDCFLGSGTTAVVAQKLYRNWIGCDINKGAIQVTINRLLEVLSKQTKEGKKLEFFEDVEHLEPAQFSFSVFRVNDYDMHIQHNEAVELVCEHIGIQRTRNDSFFDGIHGKKLAKIIPFHHPLNLLDLEEIKRELIARPEEERDITVVCLGKEIAITAWLEEWNILRKRGDVPNKIEVIELRTDPRYGKFFTHKPAQAKLSVKRTRNKVKIKIKDFVSPTIIERLKNQAGLLTPQIHDWRTMVDTVMIDPDYNGSALNVVLADVPKRKDDLIIGEYEITIPERETTIAIKITDMLGEEVLVIQKV